MTHILPAVKIGVGPRGGVKSAQRRSHGVKRMTDTEIETFVCAGEPSWKCSVYRPGRRDCEAQCKDILQPPHPHPPPFQLWEAIGSPRADTPQTYMTLWNLLNTHLNFYSWVGLQSFVGPQPEIVCWTLPSVSPLGWAEALWPSWSQQCRLGLSKTRGPVRQIGWRRARGVSALSKMYSYGTYLQTTLLSQASTCKCRMQYKTTERTPTLIFEMCSLAEIKSWPSSDTGSVDLCYNCCCFCVCIE